MSAHEGEGLAPEGVAAPLEPSRKEFSLQLHIDWLAQDEISDFRNWLIEKLWTAAAVSKHLQEELAKCGKENCMGHDTEGCRRWVSEERLNIEKRKVVGLEKEITALRETKL